MEKPPLKNRINVTTMLMLLLAGAAHAATDVPSLRNELRESHETNDGARMSKAAAELRAVFAGHPSYLFYAARGAALSGNTDQALALLDEIAVRGIDMLHAVHTDAAFERVRKLPTFSKLEKKVANLYVPRGNVQVAWSFGPPDTQPEALAVHPDGRVFLGSVRRGEVLIRTPGGNVIQWPVPGRWSAQGMHLSPDNKTLWVATSAMNASREAETADRGRTALVAFDADNGKVLARHELSLDGEHVLGDFIFLDAYTLLATDSIGGGIYSLDTRNGTFTTRVEPGTLRSPQGLARLRGMIYVADYSNGIYRLEPATGLLSRVDDGEQAAPYGIDGLYAHEGKLLAIHNGVRPYQVNVLGLSTDGLRITSRRTLANPLSHGEPTLGTLVENRFLFVGNSLWNHVDRDGGLDEQFHARPVILSLEL